MQLKSLVNDVKGITDEDECLIIVADVNSLLHIRIFDEKGRMEVLECDDKMQTERAHHVANLKEILSDLWNRQLTMEERVRIFHAVRAIAEDSADPESGDYAAKARKQAKLSHPGIIRVLDAAWDEKEGFFIVLEFVDGPTLDVRLEQLRLTDNLEPREGYHEKLAGLLADVADAVHFANDKGFVHCDLKPKNILIDIKEDRPRVTDFGFAIGAGETLMGTAPRGTLHYLAPEQVVRLGKQNYRANLDRRVDVWAIGVILYEALCQRHPFAGPGVERVHYRIVFDTPAPPSEAASCIIPRELERICLKCLAKQKDGRYANVGELRNDLKAWINRPEPKAEVPRELKARLRNTTYPVIGREKDLSKLDSYWHEGNIRIVTIIGESGVGKSALIDLWLKLKNEERWPEAEWVFYWSFSDLERENWVTSVNQFLSAAMRSLGGDAETSGSPWRKRSQAGRTDPGTTVPAGVGRAG